MKTYEVKVLEKDNEESWMAWGFSAGTILWYDENGKYHCEHGPAIEHSKGHDVYYWHGWRGTKEEWQRKVAETKQHTIEIDGKTITISHESYENIKKELTK